MQNIAIAATDGCTERPEGDRMSILKINGCKSPSVTTMAFHKKTRCLKLTILCTASFHHKTEEIPFLS